MSRACSTSFEHARQLAQQEPDSTRRDAYLQAAQERLIRLSPRVGTLELNPSPTADSQTTLKAPTRGSSDYVVVSESRTSPGLRPTVRSISDANPTPDPSGSSTAENEEGSNLARTPPTDSTVTDSSDSTATTNRENTTAPDAVTEAPPPPLTSQYACAGQQLPWNTLYSAVHQDVLAQPAADRPFLRYATLANRFNAGVCPEDLSVERLALLEAINSVSLNPAPVSLQATDEAELIYRLDLRQMQWERAVSIGEQTFETRWFAIQSNSAYAVELENPDAIEISLAVADRTPVVHADALIATALSANVYYALLGLDPEGGLDALRQTLGVDVDAAMDARQVVRAGTYSRSALEDNNAASSLQGSDLLHLFERIVQRVPLPSGPTDALWEVFYFSSQGASSIFDDPLDTAEDNAEVMFSLPNGLNGFAIVDDDGRLSTTSAVRFDDLERLQPGTLASSCLRCHGIGPVAVEDEVRAVVEMQPLNFNVEDYQDILTLYPLVEDFQAQLQADQLVLGATRALLGASLQGDNPVATVAARFSSPLFAADMAGEFGVTEAYLLEHVEQLGPILEEAVRAGRSLSRAVFESRFFDNLCALRADFSPRPYALSCPANAP